MNPRILVIDDDPGVILAYRDILADHGFEVAASASAAEALDALDQEGPWDVILLDEKLEGSGGPASAAGLLIEIAGRAPEARTIVITGFATPSLVRAALQAGAWDYLEKDAQFLKLLLPLRVRHAAEAARDRRLSRSSPSLEAELRRTWAAAQDTGATPHQRGRLLEETLGLLFRTMPGLEEARVGFRGTGEEIDLVVENASSDPILQREGPLLLAECKNWSSTVGPPEYNHFRSKLKDRFQRATLGILVSMNGFTGGVENKQARAANERELILLLDRHDLDQWIDAPDRIAWLRARILATALRA